jgi:nitrate reductase cytochrome c-type subunit
MIFREAFDVAWQDPVSSFSYDDLVLFRAAALYQAKTDTASCLGCRHFSNNRKIGSTDLSIFDMLTRLLGTSNPEGAQASWRRGAFAL